MTGHIPHIEDRALKWAKQRANDPHFDAPLPVPQISYDPNAKAPTYTLEQTRVYGDDDGVKAVVEKREPINHKNDIKQSYIGHFPKSKWVNEKPKAPEREYTPEETA